MQSACIKKPKEGPDVKIAWYGTATLSLESAHTKLLFDPFLRMSKKLAPLNPERLRKLTERYISSNAKIKAALGVEKMPVDAREGLKVTLKSFQ